MKTGHFTSNTGLNIFYRHWPAGNNPSAMIICIHGLAGDSMIFNYFAEKMSSIDYDVYAIDLPGFGNSDGEKGDVSFDVTMQCLHDVLTTIKKEHDGSRCTAYRHR